MVLYRYGSTGAIDIIDKVVKTRNFFPVYLRLSKSSLFHWSCKQISGTKGIEE